MCFSVRKRKLKANYKTKDNVHVPFDSEEVNNPGQKKETVASSLW